MARHGRRSRPLRHRTIHGRADVSRVRPHESRLAGAPLGPGPQSDVPRLEELGEADASIVYVSDAIALPELQRIDIPAEMNVIAEYPITPLAESTNTELANDFIDYVLSPAGQVILKKWGFTPIVP